MKTNENAFKLLTRGTVTKYNIRYAHKSSLELNSHIVNISVASPNCMPHNDLRLVSFV